MTDRYEPDARASERSPEREVVDSGQSEDDLCAGSFEGGD
jgi:hypothetical protein